MRPPLLMIRMLLCVSLSSLVSIFVFLDGGAQHEHGDRDWGGDDGAWNHQQNRIRGSTWTIIWRQLHDQLRRCKSDYGCRFLNGFTKLVSPAHCLLAPETQLHGFAPK